MATEPRQPGEIRPRDRVITSGRRREIGYVVTIDGDTAHIVFAGIDDKTWPMPLAKLARHWHVRRTNSALARGPFRVEAKHTQYGFLPRGTIRSIGIQGHSIVWQVQDYDGNQLDDVVGDYMLAERTLLEATAELDGDPGLTEEAVTELASLSSLDSTNPRNGDPQP
jgi:hypothetical protein